MSKVLVALLILLRRTSGLCWLPDTYPTPTVHFEKLQRRGYQ